MPNNVQDSAMMICYRECLSNLEKFNGDAGKKVLQFVNNIERIGKMIDASKDILYCMCTAKLDGEAKRWYEDNMSLTQWEDLKSALLDRFMKSGSSSKLFEQLRERQQQADETITSYYDAIIKLCREYDSDMSQKMMISWLENGVKDSLRIPIKRQMKLLSESARTTQAFLKIAKDEQELQEESLPTADTTTSYTPYFTNTVSTTLPQTENTHSNTLNHSKFTRFNASSEPIVDRRQHNHLNREQTRRPQPSYTSSRQRLSASPLRSSTYYRNTTPAQPENHILTNTTSNNVRQSDHCWICQRPNHRSIDCYYKQPHGCYKCGQSDHRLRDCPQVFY